MRDQLEALAGVERDVDQATRDYAGSLDRMRASFAKGGGLSAATEEGRANADAISAAVEQAERLAEAQAKVDTTGQTSAQTLLDVTNQLGALYEQGSLTSDEYAHLIDLYGLTPERITTTIEAYTTEAEGQIAALQAEFDAKKAHIEAPIAAEIQTAINQGRYDEARAKLAAIPRTIPVQVVPTLTPLSAPIFKGFQPPAPMGGRAQGGPVTPGTWLVGEKGPELLEIPGGVSGNVVTNHESRARVADAFGVTVGGDGASIGGPMSMDPMSMRSSFVELGTAVQQMGSSITAAVASARPIVINGAVSPRRTAEELVVQESRMLRRVAR